MKRVCPILVLICLPLWPAGCRTPGKQKPVWEQVKISDLAPPPNNQRATSGLLKTINFDVHIIEMPADKIGELDAVWRVLRTQPLRLGGYRAFLDNLFRAGFGQIGLARGIYDSVRYAGGREVATISLLLTDGQANDLTVAELNAEQTISFVSGKGARQKATIGPGVLVLRIKAEKVPQSRGVCQFIACPVFTLPITSSIPEFTARAKAREFVFDGAAFGTRMSLGDLVLLGPASYNSDQSTLGGLFFSKPQGTLFFGTTEHKRPERRPAVRLFLLVCTGIND